MDSRLTKYLALDCEMVGISPYYRKDMLARVSIVNEDGVCVYDEYVKPKHKVYDYRTPVSGIRKSDLQNGKKFETVQEEVKNILKQRIVVGHSLKSDFAVLKINHAKKFRRDTAEYLKFEKMNNYRTPSLKWLAFKILGQKIQTGEHSSIEDARAVMKIYQSVASEWEAEFTN